MREIARYLGRSADTISRGQVATHIVQLYKALGGGWAIEDPPDVTQASGGAMQRL